MRTTRTLSLIAALALLAGCGGDEEEKESGSASVPDPIRAEDSQSAPQGARKPNDAAKPLSAGSESDEPQTVLAENLAVPWGIAFLPNGDALIAERTTASILRLDASGGEPEEVMSVPGVDTGAGEGGCWACRLARVRARRARLRVPDLTGGQPHRPLQARRGARAHPDRHHPL